MKLKCDDHNRRVLRVSEEHFTHRSDGSVCHSQLASIGEHSFTPDSQEFSGLKSAMSAEECELLEAIDSNDWEHASTLLWKGVKRRRSASPSDRI